MSRWFTQAVALVLGFMATAARAADLHVPAQYPAIQAAINAASDGDRIVIAAGTYHEALDLLGKDLTLRGATGPDGTILDGAGLNASIVTCDDGEFALFEFLTFTGGEATLATHCAGQGVFAGRFGGAIYIVGGQVMIHDCVFSNNGNSIHAQSWGGAAIFGSDTDLTVAECRFNENGTANLAPDPNEPGQMYGSAVGFCGAEGQLNVSRSTFENNGRNGAMGSVHGSECRLRVSECTFTGNSASFGGGVSAFVGTGAVTVADCTFVANFASFGGGLAAYAGSGVIFGGSPGPGTIEVTGCTFEDNTASHAGGAHLQATHNGSIRLADSVFLRNIVAATGGGASVEAGSGDPNFPDPVAEVERCVFRENECTGPGGQVFGGGLKVRSFFGSVRVNRCRMEDNFAFNRGGGAYMYIAEAGEIQLLNTVLVGNSTGTRAGGAAAEIGEGGDIRIVNCSIVANQAGSSAGGIGTANAFGGQVLVSNSIVRGNTPSQIGGTPLPVVEYCNVQGGSGGAGNIDADPLFADPALRDFAIVAGSPCIDAGRNEFLPEGITLDLAGEVRRVDDPDTVDTGVGTPPVVDIGAYEFQAGGCVGDLDGSGDIGLQDLSLLLANFGSSGPALPGDLDADNDVDLQDLAMLLSVFGSVC